MGTVSANDTPRSGGSGNVSWSDTSGTALVRPDGTEFAPAGLVPLSSGVSIWDADVTGGDIGGSRYMNVPSPYNTTAVAADRDGWAASQTTGGAANLTLTGTQPAAANEVTLYSTGNLSGVTFTITGTDQFGAAASTSTSGPNNTTKTINKAFATVTQISVNGAVGTAVEVGWPASDEAKSIVHPSIVATPQGWNGYRYWLAFTPYRNSNSAYENPCIGASNDFSTWVAPGMNPIVASAPGSAYLSDPHLYLLPDGSKMLMLYRDSGVVAGADRFLLMESTDGVTWSAPVVIWTKASSGGNPRLVAPSFFYDGTNWAIYAHDINAAGYPLVRLLRAGNIASIYTDWSSESLTTCVMPNPRGATWWHSHLQRLSDGRIIGVASDNNAAAGQMWLLQSDDGANFAVKETPFSANAAYRCSLHIEPDATGQAAALVVTVGRVESTSPAYRFIRVAYRLIGKSIGRQSAVLTAQAKYAMSVNDKVSDVLAADDFTGTVSTNIGTTLDGKSWVHNDTNNIQYNGSGRATNENTSNCIAWVDLGVATYSVQVKIITRLTTGDVWLLSRVVDGSNRWRFGAAGASSGLYLQSVVSGNLGVNQLVPNVTVADGDILRVESDGAWLYCYHNGRLVFSWNDATFATATKVGLQIRDSAAGGNTLVDDFFAHKLS